MVEEEEKIPAADAADAADADDDDGAADADASGRRAPPCAPRDVRVRVVAR